MTDTEMIQAWLDWYEAGDASPGTIGVRRSHLRRFALAHDLRSAVEADLVVFVTGCGAANSRRSALASLRSFYLWAVRRGLVPADPSLGMRAIREPQGIPRPISEAALSQALERADHGTRMMLLLGAYAGLRLAEIAGVHSDDVTDLGLMVRGKGGKTRRIPIHPMLLPCLSGLAGFAFPGRWGGHAHPDYVANHLERVLPHPFTAHALRHRFATRTYAATHDIRSVQQLLGHSSVATTQRYVQVDHDALAAAVFAVA